MERCWTSPAFLSLKPVHTFADIDENVTVLLRDADRYDFGGDSDVLVMLHKSVEVDLFDVDSHELCIWSGQFALKEELGCGQVGYERAVIS